ncbi:protein of unknown function [Magnetospirillum sp. XM-1]|nr:protein of unknown function [Magnetospirillum sp. XM-1]
MPIFRPEALIRLCVLKLHQIAGNYFLLENPNAPPIFPEDGPDLIQTRVDSISQSQHTPKVNMRNYSHMKSTQIH